MAAVVVESRGRKECAREMRSEKGDQFRRLPDELLMFILNKVADAKWLCRCSIVSKRFASVVFYTHTHTVSIQIPQCLRRNSEPEEISIADKRNAFLQFVSGFLDAFKGVFQFLTKFDEIHFLHIDFPTYRELGHEGMFKWVANFGTQLESFTIVLSSSICKMTNPLEEEQQQREPETEISIDLGNKRLQQAFECINDSFLRHFILLLVVEQLTSLQSAAITDLRNRVNLSVGNKQLPRLTDLANQTTIISLMEHAESFPKCVKVGHVPVLRLPSCGYMMKGATILVMEQVDQQKEIDNGGAGYDHAVIGGGFEGVERAFEEAVTEMLTNHGDKMQTITLP